MYREKIKSRFNGSSGSIGIVIGLVLAVAILMSAVAPVAAFTGVSPSWDSEENQPYVTLNNGGTSEFTVESVVVNGTTSDSISATVAAGEQIDIYLGTGSNDATNNKYYAGLSDGNIPLQSDNLTIQYSSKSDSTHSYDLSPSVSGTVFNSADERLEGATVNVGSQSVTTSADGTYSANLTGLTVADLSEVDVTVDDGSHYETTQTVNVTPDASSTSDFFLSSVETVTVEVDEEVETTNSEGETTIDFNMLEGATVGLYEVDQDSNGEDVQGALVTEGTTDADGVATLDVEKGDYFLVVEHPDQYVDSSAQETEYEVVEQQITVEDDMDVISSFFMDGTTFTTYTDGESIGIGGVTDGTDVGTIAAVVGGLALFGVLVVGVFGFFLRELLNR